MRPLRGHRLRDHMILIRNHGQTIQNRIANLAAAAYHGSRPQCASDDRAILAHHGVASDHRRTHHNSALQDPGMIADQDRSADPGVGMRKHIDAFVYRTSLRRLAGFTTQIVKSAALKQDIDSVEIPLMIVEVPDRTRKHQRANRSSGAKNRRDHAFLNVRITAAGNAFEHLRPRTERSPPPDRAVSHPTLRD